MDGGSTIFSQIMAFMPLYEFNKCVARYKGNYKVQSFTCLQQLYVMAFAQLTYRESLRDIETCLNAMRAKLYHMGIRSPVARSTIAEANENRDWRMYADFAQVLISIARPLYAEEDIGIDLDATVYALDSTTIDLCLSLFSWAKFRRHKGAVKMHTLIDIQGPIPVFVWITEGKVHDVNVLDILQPEAGAFYLVDGGYTDFSRLHTITSGNAFFVTRSKVNLQFRRIYSNPSDMTNGVLSDQVIALTGVTTNKDYPEKIRRVHFYDVEHKKHLYFLTNNFSLPAVVIAQLYKCRWKVELFFKWIKQHLRIKVFYGLSENAVKTQLWIAICVYVLVAIVKKKLKLEHSLYTILQIISVLSFEKLPLSEAFHEIDVKEPVDDLSIQLNLFEL